MSSHRTVLLELAGVPAAGKTSTARALQAVLECDGLRAAIVRESASISPLRKLRGRWEFNAWNTMKLFQRLLEVTVLEPPPDVAIVDRGVFDALTWFTWLRRRGALGSPQHDAIQAAIGCFNWTLGPDLLVLLHSEFATSVRRRNGRTGFVVQPRPFEQLVVSYDEQLRKVRQLWPTKHVVSIDTNLLSPQAVASAVEKEVRKLLEQASHGIRNRTG